MEPIVIVGAGPVGLISAMRLSQLEIPSIIIEKNQIVQDELRASTFHPPTLEMLDVLGITKELISIGLQTSQWQYRIHETEESAVFDLCDIEAETKYPFRLQVEQKELCRIATEKILKDDNIELRMGHELLGFEQNNERVMMTVSGREQAEYFLKAPIVIAADGGNSRLRKQMALNFSGLTYPETTILVATKTPFHEHLNNLSNVNYIWSDWGTFSLLRLPNIWRCSLYPDTNERTEEAIKKENIIKKIQRIIPSVNDFKIVEVRPYKIHQRILDKYDHGRVVFAGDAAHLNSPSGGMGMNGGIHDAWSLGRIAADILRGEQPISRLALYSKERQKIAKKEILQNAHKNRSRMQERDKETRINELAKLQEIALDPRRAKEFLLRSSMISGLKGTEKDY